MSILLTILLTWVIWTYIHLGGSILAKWSEAKEKAGVTWVAVVSIILLPIVAIDTTVRNYITIGRNIYGYFITRKEDEDSIL